jgi:hypothetical protein
MNWEYEPEPDEIKEWEDEMKASYLAYLVFCKHDDDHISFYDFRKQALKDLESHFDGLDEQDYREMIL